VSTDVQAPAADELEDQVVVEDADLWAGASPPSVDDLVDLRDVVRRAMRTRRVGGRELSADEFAALEHVDAALIRKRLVEPGGAYSATPPSERPAGHRGPYSGRREES
jgi:hypothetical protein